MSNVSAKRDAELERARLGREKRFKALSAGPEVPKRARTMKESSTGVDDSSGVDKPVGVASPKKVIAATPLNSALPAETVKSPSTASNPLSDAKGTDHSTGGEKVTTVNFTLPSDFMSGNILDGMNLFPHLEKFQLPSFKKRFEGLPIEETGSHVAGLVFMALQASLAFRGESSKMKDSLSVSREKERAALDRASVSVNRAEDLSKQLDEACRHLKSVQRVKEDLSLRLTHSLSMTAEQKKEMDDVKKSLAAALKEVEDCRSQMEDLEREVQAAKDEGKTVFALARLTARAAIMRRHLLGKDPLASAKEELDIYLDRVGAERDLDSDDEKEVDEEMVNKEVEEEVAGENLQVEVSGTNATDTPLA